MDKFNFLQDAENKLTDHDIIKKFFQQIKPDKEITVYNYCPEGIWSDTIVFRCNPILPVGGYNYTIYAVCNKDEINKILDIDNNISYTVEKNEIQKPHSIKLHKLSWSEDCCHINLKLVQDTAKDRLGLRVVIAQDDLMDANFRFWSCVDNIIF